MSEGGGIRSQGLLLAALALVAVVLALSSPWLTFVRQMQVGPVESLNAATAQQDYVTGVFWAVLLTGIVAIWGTIVRFRTPLLLVWLAKVVVALALMLPYDYIYGVDPDGYFINASSPGFSWNGFQLGQGTLNIQQLVFLHFHWLTTSYNAARLTFALVGLAAVYLVYRAAVNLTKEDHPRLFYVLALTPSILFWSSILGKDPVSLFSVAAYLYGVSLWRGLRKQIGVLWILGSVLIAVYLRSWLGPILIVPLMIYVAAEARSPVMKLAVLAVALAGLAASPSMLQSVTGVELGRPDTLVQTAGDLSRSFEQGGSSLAPPEIRGYEDLARFAPMGMFTILFRPLPGEVPNAFGTLAGIENVCLLLLAIRAGFRLSLRRLADPLTLWLVAILILWAAVYSVVSYQNLGTASRYKLEIAPLLICALLYIGRKTQSAIAGASPAMATAGAPLRPHWNV